MALEDYGSYNPFGEGGIPTPRRRPTPPPADVPRGGQPVPPVAPLWTADILLPLHRLPQWGR